MTTPRKGKGNLCKIRLKDKSKHSQMVDIGSYTKKLHHEKIRQYVEGIKQSALEMFFSPKISVSKIHIEKNIFITVKKAGELIHFKPNKGWNLIHFKTRDRITQTKQYKK
uniref:Uncharacterized protein n=1 Tax=Cucumis melo TaxID=3656 RepID=A0A9I9EHN0_CUCME